MEIVASHDLDALRAALAQRLSQPSGTPTERLRRAFDAEVIVVPSTHMRKYLERELARDLGSTGNNDGIVANIDFLQPRHLVYASIGQVPALADVRRVLGIGHSPWDAERLTWTIDDIIRRSGIAVPSHRTAPLTTAHRIAELFDHYTTHRPEMLRQWRDHSFEGTDLSGTIDTEQIWQRDLYRLLASELEAECSLAVLNLDTWRVHVSAAKEAGVLPARIALFGVTGLSRAVRDVIGVIADHCEVTAYVVHSAITAWPTLAPNDHETRESWNGRQLDDTANGLHHPLHGRWCAHSLEQAALLGPPTTVIGEHNIERHHLLGAVRADVISDAGHPAELLDDAALETALRNGDGSIQVHACYGSLRQAEALRDALLRLLRDDPTLKLRDITVVSADPASAAPILNAVFDPRSDENSSASPTTSLKRPPRLPVNVIGADAGSFDPLAEAFLAVIGLTTARCSPAEVLEVVSLPPVARYFGLDRDAVERIADWAEQAGVRHGLDPDHRLAATNVPLELVSSTWRDALARVAVGVAVPAPVDIVGPGGVVPFDAVSSGDTEIFGAFAEFIERLARLSARLGPGLSMTINEWSTTALHIVDDFIAATSDETESMVALRRAITSLAQTAPGVDSEPDDREFPVSELLSATTARFSPEYSSFFTPWESVTITSLDGLAHRPTRVVAVFDANEDMFAGPAADGDNVLAQTPLVGEPHYAMAARQGFLHAMMAARDAIVVTCDGADVSNNKKIPLAIAVREFLETVAATMAHNTNAGAHPVLVRHPRQNHHPDVLTPGRIVPGEAFTFDPAASLAHRRGAAESPSPGSTGSPTTPRTTDVTLSDIVRAVRNPLEFHLRDVLGVDLPPDPNDSSPDDRNHIHGDGVIHLTIDALERSSEGRHLLDHLVKDPQHLDAAISSWVGTRTRTGVLPPGKIGDAIARDIGDELAAMLALAPFSPGHGIGLDCTFAVDGQSFNTRIQGVHPQLSDLVRVRYKRFSESILLEPWVDLAALTLSDRGTIVRTAHVVARGRNSKEKAPTHWTLVIAGDSADERMNNAEKVISVASRIHQAAAQDHLPLFERASHALERNAAEAAEAFLTDLDYSHEARFLLRDKTFADVLDEKTNSVDHSIFGAAPGGNRAAFYAGKLWGTFYDTCKADEQ